MAICKPNWEHFSSRLKSFDDISDKLNLNPVSLAHAGFYYFNGDTLCYSCGYVLRNLSDIFEPCFEHVFYTTARSRDICSYLKRTTGIHLHHTFIMHKFSSDPLDIEKHGPNNFEKVFPYGYDLFINRFISFTDVDVDFLPFSPLVLAHLGYYYHANSEVYCFDCKFPLSYSRSLLNQVEGHMLQSCEYMKSILGSDVSVLSFMKCLV